MKTSKLFKGLALGVMFAFVTSATYAGDGDKTLGSVSILPYLDTDYSIVSVSNLGDKNAIFSIKDEEGQTVYKEWVNKAGIEQKVLDFSLINDGVYTATLKAKGLKEVTKTFIIENKKQAGKEDKISSTNNPIAFFHLADNTLTVSHLAFGSPTFHISICDEIGKEFYGKGYSGNSAFSGKFNISSLPKGNYKVSLNSGNKEYSYDFRK